MKEVIKQTQLSKKAAQAQQQRQQASTSAQPSLCGSMPPPPPVADYFADSIPHSRRPSILSPFSYDFPQISPDDFLELQPPQSIMSHGPYPMFSPYEIDIKTERQIYVNDVPTRRDSTISTFNTYQPPPLSDGMLAYPEDSWVQQEHHESFQESFTEEPVDFNFFQFPHGSMSPDHETVINVEECDKHLLDHFLDKVLKLIFPILDANQHGSARADVILPALESNTAYLSCCLSIAAAHKKATEGLSGEQIDNDIVRHRFAVVSELVDALKEDVNHAGILEATLGMIFFQCSVGRPEDVLPDIPWHQHFEAATSLVMKLDLPSAVLNLGDNGFIQPPFNMTLASWVDILGSTMLGRSPTFADTYRELNLRRGSAGLAELMGCDDTIMFLISEIACLDMQKREGAVSELQLCNYVTHLADAITLSQPPPGAVQSCFSSTGAIRPKQLTTNISAVFRVAARVYLCALVPGFEPRQPSMCHLISQFAEFMNFIPAGPEGFDRSLVWPLLVAGSVSVEGSLFRTMFEQRSKRLGDGSKFGSFGRISELLKDIWQINDAAAARGEYQGVHWRDVMQQKGWDFLLI